MGVPPTIRWLRILNFVLLMTSKFTHLSRGQRYQIEALLATGISQTAIAGILGVNRSTVSRELRRNSVRSAKPPDRYKAANAQSFAEKRAYRPPKSKSCNGDVVRRMSFLLKRDRSPEQIAACCALKGLAMLSTEGIYLWIYAQPRTGVDYTSFLRRHHRKRRKRRLSKQPRTIIKDRTSIHGRPEEVALQARFGDVETDLVKCANGYLLTITERKSLFNFIVKLPNKEAATIQNAIIRTLEPWKGRIHSITGDNGTEFACHKAVGAALGLPWYFADPYRSQQRGCNANQNGLVRQYFTRKTDLDKITDTQIMNVQNRLNNRPRKKNKFISPIKMLRLHHVAFAA